VNTIKLTIIMFLVLSGLVYGQEESLLNKNDKVVAVVLGQKIYDSRVRKDGDEKEKNDMKQKLSEGSYESYIRSFLGVRMRSIILNPLLKQYEKENAFEVTEEEIEQYLKFMGFGKGVESITVDVGPKGEEPVVPREHMKIGASYMIKGWKRNRALFDKYGGKVLCEQMGCDPIGAFRKFLEESEKIGAFEIYDSELRGKFWEYFIDVESKAYISEEEGKRLMATPFWQWKRTNE